MRRRNLVFPSNKWNDNLPLSNHSTTPPIPAADVEIAACGLQAAAYRVTFLGMLRQRTVLLDLSHSIKEVCCVCVCVCVELDEGATAAL